MIAESYSTFNQTEPNATNEALWATRQFNRSLDKKMEFDDSFYKMIKDLQRQIAPFRDFERISGSAFRNITHSIAEREKLLQSIMPDLSSRFKNIAELAQRDLAHYTGLSETAKHMAGIVNSTSLVSEFFKDQKSLTLMAEQAIGASKHWQTQVDVFKRFAGETEAYRLAFKTHYADIAKLSLIAQMRVQQLRWRVFKILCQSDKNLIY